MARQTSLGTHRLRTKARRSNGLLVVGVIISVRYPEEVEERFPGWGRVKGPLCDVRLYGREGGPSILKGVPMMQHLHGMNDVFGLYDPQESDVDISGKEVVAAGPGFNAAPDPGTPSAREAIFTEPSLIENLNGTHVVIGFLHNDTAQPVILGTISHPATPYRHESSTKGSLDVFRWRGSTFGVDPKGNLEIDTTEATDGTPDPNDLTTRTSLDDGSAGNVTVTVKENATLTVQFANSSTTIVLTKDKVVIDGAALELGQSPTQPIVLGQALLDAIHANIKAVFDSHQHGGFPPIPTTQMPLIPSSVLSQKSKVE